MKNKRSNEASLLRQYIRESLLSEDVEFGGSGDAAGGYYDEGAALMASAGGGDPSGLIKTFITPFTDVFKTVVASTKMLATDTSALLQVAFKTVISSIIPAIGARYDKIFARRDKKIEEIKSEYKEVFDRTDAAFDGDAKLLAFMASPAAFLGSAAALKIPTATKDVLSVATGGATDSAFQSAKSAWDSIQERILAGEKSSDLKRERAAMEDEFLSSLSSRLKSRARRSESMLRSSSLIREEDVKKKNKKGGDDNFDKFLKDILSSEKIVSALSDMIKNNEDLKDLKQKLSKTEDETLKEAEALSQKVLTKINTFEDIEKLAAGNSKIKKEIDKIKSIKDQKQRDGAVKMLASNIKSASKQTFLATLGNRMKLFPKDSDLHKKYQDTLNKLKSV